jgi:hypothetical protein
MKLTLSTSHAADLLHNKGENGFSYAGALSLVEWLEEMEDEAGADMELDAVAIRCDWAEYESLEAWAGEYFATPEDANEQCRMDDDMLQDERDERIRDFISNQGAVIEFEGGVIVSAF